MFKYKGYTITYYYYEKWHHYEARSNMVQLIERHGRYKAHTLNELRRIIKIYAKYNQGLRGEK